MLSIGEQAGLEATIIRPDGTKLKECEVQHSKDNNGAAVTECWIECGDDTSGHIKLEGLTDETPEFRAIHFFAGTSFRYTRYNAGLKAPFFRKSFPTCSAVDIRVVSERATVDPGTMLKIGRTTITFAPFAWSSCESKDGPTGPTTVPPIKPKRKAKNARVPTRLQEAVIMEEVILPDDKSEPMNVRGKLNPGWQTFIFNYRQKAPLETEDLIVPTLPPQDIATKRPRDDASDKAQNKKSVIRPVAGPSTTAAAVISSNESIVQDADKEWEDLKAERIKALQNARNSTQAGMDGLLNIGYELNDATEERWMAGKADRIKVLQDKIDTIQTEIDFLSGNTAKWKRKGKISAKAKADQSVDLSLDAD